MHLLSAALNILAAHKAQDERLKMMESRAREFFEKAYEDARYPHLIEGHLAASVDERAK
jgi:hypothetical protein